ncbi:RNA polymerase sigma factor [Patulibacter minatonensis]|uniref:RNA polymerase sigma factor n=1 Tax=Patulibacter minatonensis TaxID=298163 RepID=UPI000478EEA8|nr:sigma-70 family RNA polymerase sigma factor [Patulibacter minatonensis]
MRASPPPDPPAPPPFDVVVERHGPGVLRFCVARLGPDRGEECFQETLLAALRAYDGLRDPGAAGGWLFQIAQRKIVDAARSVARAPTPAGDALEAHADPWHDPEPGSGIWATVARLPPKQREAVGLRYLADLSHADVAAVMGTSVDAARRNVFEGLRRLRDEVGR